jgi:hypothetical protein
MDAVTGCWFYFSKCILKELNIEDERSHFLFIFEMNIYR